MLRPSSILTFLLALSACGDIGSVRLEVTFPDDETSAETRALLVVVREPPAEGDGCDVLWSESPTGLAETRSVVLWPNRSDVVAAPVKLSMYPALTFLVYAHPTEDPAASAPIAAGCAGAKLEADESSALALPLAPRP